MTELMQRRRALMGAQKTSRLPAEYQEVEWIGRDSGHEGYLQLENVSANDNVTFRTKQTDLFSSGEASFAGPGSGALAGSWEISYTNREIKIWKPNTTTLVAINYGDVFDSTEVIFQSQQSFAFGVYRAPNNYKFYGRMFGATVVRNSTTVHDYVPCYKKSDNKIGMFDLVGGNFYSSVTADSFTKGPDVK